MWRLWSSCHYLCLKLCARVPFQFTYKLQNYRTSHPGKFLTSLYSFTDTHSSFKQANDTFVTEAESCNSVVRPSHMAAAQSQGSVRSFGHTSTTTPHITLALADTIGSFLYCMFKRAYQRDVLNDHLRYKNLTGVF